MTAVPASANFVDAGGTTSVVDDTSPLPSAGGVNDMTRGGCCDPAIDAAANCHRDDEGTSEDRVEAPPPKGPPRERRLAASSPRCPPTPAAPSRASSPPPQAVDDLGP